MVIIVLLMIFFACSVQAQEDICSEFRITSPLVDNLHWLSGQCYQISYDLGSQEIQENPTITVDLIHSKTMEKEITLVMEEPISSVGATTAFVLNVTSTDIYHYSITLIQNELKCPPKRSVDFKVTFNPNSPTVEC